MAKHLDYYCSPMSPWTYLGHARMREIARNHGASVRIMPVDYGKIFPASGGLPLKQRPIQRQSYRLVELKRWSEWLHVPIKLHPKFFPIPADLASKVILCAAPSGADKQLDLAGAIMKACWEEDRDISDAATMSAIATACGLDGTTLLARANEPAAQVEYERLTQQAIDKQVFGAPTYVYDGELFWGQDRLDFLDRALARN